MALFAPGSIVPVRALLIGERIDLKGLETPERLATNPLVIKAGPGRCAALFRYGTVVLFGFAPEDEARFLDSLSALVGQPYPRHESEGTRLRVDPSAEDRAEGGEIVLREATVEAVQVIADVLAKSVVLAYYDASLATAFDAVEPLARDLRSGRQRPPRDRALLRYIGDTLLAQHKMVGRVEVGEKPEVLWELPGLNRLFLRLEDEYELVERQFALDRKLVLITRTVETLVDLAQNRRALRVEWYIVALILVEIGLTLYQLFWRR